MSTEKIGTRRISQQGESAWTWELSAEQFRYGELVPQLGLDSIRPKTPTGTVIYEDVPADHALIDDLLNESEYDEAHWACYENALRRLATISASGEAAWSSGQIGRTRQYVDTSKDEQEKLTRLSQQVLETIDTVSEPSNVGKSGEKYPIKPGVPIGLGRVILDPTGRGMVLAPLGDAAPKAATAGRLIEELIWVSSLIQAKSEFKARMAIKLAVSVANSSPKYPNLLLYSTLLAFSAHVQRRLSAPMAPAETVDIFWPAIVKVAKNPAEVGLPWKGVR
ncbi:hypothetical protein [Auritidibacter ignavus]|uniref:hypothetical protein n=1 Tax=Auritidibacter ignavus TaxID=678932 RepID=UPI00109C3A7A|nr:hypothetical protein [Auritidibacter ignavus]